MAELNIDPSKQNAVDPEGEGQKKFNAWMDSFGDNYIGKKRKAAWWEAYNAEQNRAKAANKYLDPTSKELGLIGTPEELARAQSGLSLGKAGYGQTIFDIGSDIQRVKDLQRQRTEGTDPVSEAIRNQKLGAMANAQRRASAGGLAGGAMEGAVQDIERKTNMDVAASLYGQQAQNIAAERSLASNMLSGTTSLMYGNQAAGTAQNIPSAPQAGGFLGTVICTELYKQGYYSNEIFMHDIAYGAWIRANKPEVYIGYRLWADPVVSLMQKSKLFTKCIAAIAVPWARNMAGEYNTLGNFLSMVGEPICGFIGKVAIKLGARICTARS